MHICVALPQAAAGGTFASSIQFEVYTRLAGLGILLPVSQHLEYLFFHLDNVTAAAGERQNC
jgi:hypothetical protein